MHPSQVLILNFFTGGSAPAGRVNAEINLDSPKVVNKMEVSWPGQVAFGRAVIHLVMPVCNAGASGGGVDAK